MIYKFTIGFSDEDGDGENDEGINLFVDMCRNGVDFDASIAIIKSAGIDCKNIDGEELINNYVDGSWGKVDRCKCFMSISRRILKEYLHGFTNC